MSRNNDWKSLNIKEKFAIISACLAFVCGWGLTILGFWLPPKGEVADSVLWILGQSLIYASSVFGLASYFTSESRRMRKDIAQYVNNRLEGESYHEEG